jgi:hypothetical protein
MLSHEISRVCKSCGIRANHLTQKKKFGEDFDENKFNSMAEVSTCIKGVCQVCGYEGNVYPVRDFNYPDFSLIEQ